MYLHQYVEVSPRLLDDVVKTLLTKPKFRNVSYIMWHFDTNGCSDAEQVLGEAIAEQYYTIEEVGVFKEPRVIDWIQTHNGIVLVYAVKQKVIYLHDSS